MLTKPMLATYLRLPKAPAPAPAGQAAGKSRRWCRHGGALAAGAMLVWLGSSCASSSGKKSQVPAGTVAAAGPGGAVAKGTVNTGPGATSGRFITRATVDDVDATEAPTPGRDLLAHALSGGGNAQAEARTDDTSRAGAGGRTGAGDGVPAAAAERRVGVVRVIGAHGKFVLIETTTGYGGGSLSEGEELRSRGPAATGGAQTAVLKVSRERQAPYLVADVLAGEPQAGDIAYFTLEKRR